MVPCILNTHLQKIKNPCLMINTFFFLIIIPFVTPLSFNFTSFKPNDPNMHYERSAHLENNIIQLTTNQQESNRSASVGRATYAEPLQLWDKATGNLTDFTTQFSFVINSFDRARYGDGLSFFLAPAGSNIPRNVTKGGSMGLTPDYEPLNSVDYPFVAVEFDIYSNHFDPPYQHVGIDINSMESVRFVRWWSNVSIMEGRTQDAWINYDSASRNLSVEFTGFVNYTYIRQRLSYTVDLRQHLPELVTFGFSAARGNVSAKHSIYSWSFSSTLERHASRTDPEIISESSKNKTALAIGLAVGGSVFLGVGLLLFVFWKKRRRMMNEQDKSFDVTIGDAFERGNGPKNFSYSELIRATNKFNQKEKLGEGGFGGVYKGCLKEMNSYVAVKRVSKESRQGIKEYASEVKIISRLRHRNLVQLLGWCHEKNELLLVYEFMPNGSLDSHLFKGKSLLNWAIRFKIAQGLASALLYLHEEWDQCVVHRDIKSSNVMLDSNCNAKLGDFGLARLVDHEKSCQTTVLAGTMGYMAPECVITGKASKETDVYSYGVVALEIASGKRPIIHQAQDDQTSLVEFVWNLYGTGRILEAVDPQLGTDFNEQEMQQLMIVGLWCAHPDSNLRPSIRQAIRVLTSEAALPVLPQRMPVPTYSTPPLHMLSLQDGTTVSGSSQAWTSLYGR